MTKPRCFRVGRGAGENVFALVEKEFNKVAPRSMVKIAEARMLKSTGC